MDNGASNHVSNHLGNFQKIHPLFYSYLFARNGKLFPIFCHGSFLHSIVSFFYILNHILYTPQIVKRNLPVYQFANDNNITIEFDKFSIFVKDSRMGRIYLQDAIVIRIYFFKTTLAPLHLPFSLPPRGMHELATLAPKLYAHSLVANSSLALKIKAQIYVHHEN